MLTFKHSIGADTRIAFSEKPPEAIRAMMRRAGFRWSPSYVSHWPGGFWSRRGCHGAADFLAALDRAINPRRPDGACWRCQAPDGFFRPQGAATPVYCDGCHKALSAPPQIDHFDLAYEDRCAEACGL